MRPILWHGAGWNFAAFGLWHAMWVLIYLGIETRLPQSVRDIPGGWIAAVVFHILFVLTPGGLIFREHSVIEGLRHVFTAPWEGSSDAHLVAATLLALTAFGGLPMFVEWGVRKLADDRWDAFAKSGWALPAQTSAWSLAVLAMLVFHRITARDFVYFQF